MWVKISFRKGGLGGFGRRCYQPLFGLAQNFDGHPGVTPDETARGTSVPVRYQSGSGVFTVCTPPRYRGPPDWFTQ